MNVLKAAFMGIVHGFSEFLPISSSGHLALLKRIFNLNPDSLGYFTLMLNIGTLIAVIIAFREDIWGMIRETLGMLATVFANFLVFPVFPIYFTDSTGAILPALTAGISTLTRAVKMAQSMLNTSSEP